MLRRARGCPRRIERCPAAEPDAPSRRLMPDPEAPSRGALRCDPSGLRGPAGTPVSPRRPGVVPRNACERDAARHIRLGRQRTEEGSPMFERRLLKTLALAAVAFVTGVFQAGPAGAVGTLGLSISTNQGNPGDNVDCHVVPADIAAQCNTTIESLESVF